MAENIEFGKNSLISYQKGKLNDEGKYLKINNLSLDENSILRIINCNPNNKMNKLSNSKIEGHFVLDTNVCLEIDSTILKEGTVSIKVDGDCDKMTIEHTILSGDSDLRNITSISYSNIDNSIIISGDYLNISDEVISNMDTTLSKKDENCDKNSLDSIIINKIGKVTEEIDIL